MAIYYLGMKTFGRAGGKGGSRATSGAAYRAGERIRDERTGAVYDHRRRQDVLHKEIVLPRQLAAAGAQADWARDRSALWNAAERAERRRNARVAREFTIALPHELPPAARARLTLRFAQELADRYRNAVDVAIHAPRGDPRNFHAHLFATTREVTPAGLGPKTTLELSGTARYRRGLTRWAEEVASIRERWAVVANEALREAGVEARIVFRGRASRALTLAASPRLPLAAYHIERRGGRSYVAERIRERHRAERVRQALAERARLADRIPLGEWTRFAQRAAPAERVRPAEQVSLAERTPLAERAASPDALAREALRKWQAYREMQVARGTSRSTLEERALSSDALARTAAKGRGRDEDLAL